MKLGFNFSVNNLYKSEDLKTLFDIFLKYLKQKDEAFYNEYKKALYKDIENNEILIKVAFFTQEFLLDFFNIKESFNKHQEQEAVFNLIKQVQKQFINKFVKLYNKENLQNLDINLVEQELLKYLNVSQFNEIAYAKNILHWLKNQEDYKKELELACKYGAFAMFTQEGNAKHKDSFVFFKAQKIDFNSLLVADEHIKDFKTYKIAKNSKPILRQDFSLHDKNDCFMQSNFQSNYCVHCHLRGRDYCSKGQEDKEGNLKQNPNQTELAGCPLNMHISQMHYVNSLYNTLSALVLATVNNPMVAGTGHRICNDCKTSCIYQKQEPVDTPKAESIILKNILNLPFGFEIYSLLTRWNPCNFKNPYMQANSGKRVLIVGAGPAGYTLAHYLLMQGHEVVCIEGNKVEPLNSCYLANKNGELNALKSLAEIQEPLQNRTIYGFGGVSEYGITARWDKNYLKIIRIILERNSSFKLISGCAFGSNITYSNLKELGFNHVAFCTGAGKSNTLNLENSLINGVKLSSDFLMNLHLSNATLENKATFLQLRLPIVVIGGGLTAIDVATESYVYYVKMVQKLAKQYGMLTSAQKQHFKQNLKPYELSVLNEYLTHNDLFEKELENAKALNKKPNFKNIIDSLGGVKVVYRKDIESSPAYKLNHSELNYALREGIDIVTNLSPHSFNANEFNNLDSITFKDSENKSHLFNAKTAILALGNTSNKSNSSSNVEFKYESGYLKPLNGYGFIASYYNNIAISFFGDTHLNYKGSVVKAMASAKKGSLEIASVLQNIELEQKIPLSEVQNALTAKVVSVKECAKDVLEVTINSKFAAKNFNAGQFYKLQAYNNTEAKVNGIGFNMEPIPLTGAKVNKQSGDIVLYSIKAGVSTSLVSKLKQGQNVVLMGPNGKNLNLLSNQNILLVGGGLGNAVLISIAKELKEKGNNVTIVAGYKTTSHIFAQNELKANSDKLVLCVDDIEKQENGYVKGNVLQGILSLQEHNEVLDFNYSIAIGSSVMMEALFNFTESKRGELFKENMVLKCELNSLMSCMMKEVCGSCVQKLNINGNIAYEYACSSHCHDIRHVDFNFLNSRLQQNSLLEKLSYILLN